MSGWMDDAGSWDQAAVEAISFVDSLSAPPDHTDVHDIIEGAVKQEFAD